MLSETNASIRRISVLRASAVSATSLFFSAFVMTSTWMTWPRSSSSTKYAVRHGRLLESKTVRSPLVPSALLSFSRLRGRSGSKRCPTKRAESSLRHRSSGANHRGWSTLLATNYERNLLYSSRVRALGQRLENTHVPSTVGRTASRPHSE